MNGHFFKDLAEDARVRFLIQLTIGAFILGGFWVTQKTSNAQVNTNKADIEILTMNVNKLTAALEMHLKITSIENDAFTREFDDHESRMRRIEERRRGN